MIGCQMCANCEWNQRLDRGTRNTAQILGINNPELIDKEAKSVMLKCQNAEFNAAVELLKQDLMTPQAESLFTPEILELARRQHLVTEGADYIQGNDPDAPDNFIPMEDYL